MNQAMMLEKLEWSKSGCKIDKRKFKRKEKMKK